MKPSTGRARKKPIIEIWLLLVCILAMLALPLVSLFNVERPVNRHNDLVAITVLNEYSSRRPRGKIAFCVGQNGILHIRYLGEEDSATVGSVSPANEQAVMAICSALRDNAKVSGKNQLNSVGVMLEINDQRGIQLQESYWLSSPPIETAGDPWDWIDSELTELRRKPWAYQDNSERTLLLLKDLAIQYVIPDSIRRQLAQIR